MTVPCEDVTEAQMRAKAERKRENKVGRRRAAARLPSPTPWPILSRWRRRPEPLTGCRGQESCSLHAAKQMATVVSNVTRGVGESGGSVRVENVAKLANRGGFFVCLH